MGVAVGCRKGLHLVHHRPRFLPGIGPQGIEALPVLGHPHRHHRHAVDGREHLRQVPQGPVQGGSVIDPGAGDDLTVHGDLVPGEAAHDLDALPGPAVFQHLHPQRPVGGVDGHVDGGDAQVDDALHLPLGEVGQGQVVAHQKGQPGVVILEIEALPHPRRHLVHKAEDAVVGTGAGPVHEIGLELQSQVLPLLLADPQGAAGSIRGLEGKRQTGVIGIELVVQHIQDLLPVDLRQGLSRLDAGFGRRAPGLHPPDHGLAHSAPSSSQKGVLYIISYPCPSFQGKIRFFSDLAGHFLRAPPGIRRHQPPDTLSFS